MRATHGLTRPSPRRTISDVGADGIFIESPHDVGELELIGKFDVPQMANMPEAAARRSFPAQPRARLRDDLRISLLMHSVHTMQACWRSQARRLKLHGQGVARGA
jgi:2-methylisocitrate lyase-like PEP mutase family enzyme